MLKRVLEKLYDKEIYSDLKRCIEEDSVLTSYLCKGNTLNNDDMEKIWGSSSWIETTLILIFREHLEENQSDIIKDILWELFHDYNSYVYRMVAKELKKIFIIEMKRLSNE